MQRFMAELGLSPVARTRVELKSPAYKSKFAGLLGAQQPWRAADAYLNWR